VRVVDRVPLLGGVASQLVERVSLRVRLDAGGEHGIDVVVKRTGDAEVRALGLLAGMAENAIPELIATGHDERGRWIVVPFYDGEVVGLMSEPPPTVYEVMARVHVQFLGADALTSCFERIDPEFCRTSLDDFAQGAAAGSRIEMGAHPVLDRAASLARRFARDADLIDGPNRFPHTLLHGDLYGMNVLRPSRTRETPVLLDWDSARVGPAMFDVAMGVGPDSAAHAAYAAAWERASGSELDTVEAATGYAWASALVNATFAGVVARRGSPAAAASMLDEAERARIEFHRLTVSAGGR
jgi:aminoglycoside phosphotransferase (APT) family kinase protein